MASRARREGAAPEPRRRRIEDTDARVPCGHRVGGSKPIGVMPMKGPSLHLGEALTGCDEQIAHLFRVRPTRGVAQRNLHICGHRRQPRSEEHTSELQSLMRISYAVFCLKKKTTNTNSDKIH